MSNEIVGCETMNGHDRCFCKECALQDDPRCCERVRAKGWRRAITV